MFVDDNRDIDPDKPLSLEDALLLGTRLHRLTHLDEAHELYRAVLEVVPEHPDALHFLGVLEHQRKNHALALGYMQRALAQLPDAAGVHQNLGNILLQLERYDEAADAYERCLLLGGRSPQLLNNLGILRRHQRQYGAAEAAYQECLALDPNYIDAYHGYGRLLAAQNRNKEALIQYATALARDPGNCRSMRRLGFAYCVLGQFDEAARVYREWLEIDPDSAAAKHYLAACTGHGVPKRAADEYVVSTFDDFAESFDSKLESLEYRAPQLVGDCVRRLLGAPPTALDVLDAGCGTGLCGPLLAPYARKLVGIDLSAGMLTKAKLRGGYHALYKVELTAFIEAQRQSFDLIVSADTLCYFGALEAVAVAAQRALRPDGHLVFTVEALQDEAVSDGFKLMPSGRYSHRADYLQMLLHASGFADVQLEPAVLRKEAGEPVHGYVVSARRPSSATA